MDVTANKIWDEIKKLQIIKDKEWIKKFDDARMEHIEYILKLDVERTERIAIDTNKVAVKIIDALNINTQKAIDQIKG